MDLIKPKPSAEKRVVMQRGITLIQIMIFLAVIGILVTVALNRYQS